MTVLVGLYCTNGVVIGADSSATFSHGVMPTISQETTKIEIVEGRIIIATTGSVGLGQRFQHHVIEEWREKGFQKGLHHVSTSVAKRTLTDFQNTGVPKHPQHGVQFGALLAAPIGDSQTLIEFDSVSFQPEAKTATLLFVSMGSGQPIADPFLGFIRRVFWDEGLPTVREAVFGAVWTLQHTIRLNPGMVGGPPQVAILDRAAKGQWASRMLSEDELGEPLEHCDAVENHIAEYKPKILAEREVDEIPEVPKPPMNSGMK